MVDEVFDNADDLIDGVGGGVDVHGVLGWHERRDLAAAVELVALFEGVEGLVDLGLELLGGERLGIVLVTLQHAAAGTLARVGGQKDLDLCVGEHDGADVATLGHDIAILGGAALMDEHGGAHAG